MNQCPPIYPDIIVADMHPIVRLGVRSILEDYFPAARVREAENSSQLLSFCRKSSVDLVVMDLNMPDWDPKGLVRLLLALQPSLIILVFTEYKEEIFGPTYYKLGIKGYLSKTDSESEAIKAITVALAGEVYIREEMRFFYDTRNKIEDPYSLLSEKEKEIIPFLVRGVASVQICKMLALTPNAVWGRKKSIFRKLQVKSLTDFRTMMIALSQETDRGSDATNPGDPAQS